MDQNVQAIINLLQAKCKACMEEYRKEGLTFNPRACTSFCSDGQELHKLEIQVSEAEKKWDGCDWNSSQYKQYYKG